MEKPIFISLTECNYSGESRRKIAVNTNFIVRIERYVNENKTDIYVLNDPDSIYVKETPTEIIGLIKEAENV